MIIISLKWNLSNLKMRYLVLGALNNKKVNVSREKGKLKTKKDPIFLVI